MIRRAMLALAGATALGLFPLAMVWAIDGDNTAAAVAMLTAAALAFLATVLSD
jgi:hypothetical protein